MNEAAMASGVMQASILEGSNAAASSTAPSAQAVARFADRLDAPAAAGTSAMDVVRYDRPLAVGTDSAQWRPIVDFASRAGDAMRAHMQGIDARAVADVAPEALPLVDAIDRANSGMLATMQFRLVAEGLQAMGRNVQTLYQQQG